MAQNEREVIMDITVNYEEAVKGIAKYTAKIEEIKKAQESYKKALQDGQIEEEDYIKLMAAARAEMDYNKRAIQVLNKEIQNNLKIERDKQGSLNQLRAALSKANAEYAAMDEQTRKNSKDGQDLKDKIAGLTAKLKEEEEALGDHRRSVGDYEKANRNLKSELKDMVQRLAEMKLAGEDNSAAYQDLAQKAAELKDAIGDVNEEITNMASDTAIIEALNEGLQTLVASYGLYESALSAAGLENEELEETVKQLTTVMTALQSLETIRKTLLKESSLMTGVLAVQEKARSIALSLSTKSTIAATVAQKIFNAVAAMNPYLLLFLAIGSLVGALVLFSGKTDDAAEKQKKMNEQQKAWLDYLERESGKMKTISDERIKEIERQIKVLESEGNKQKEIRELEKQIAKERLRSNSERRGFHVQEIHDLEDNKKKVEQFQTILDKLNQAKADGNKKLKIDIDLDGKMDKVKVEDAIESVQGTVDNLNKSIKIAVDLQTEKKDLDAQSIIDDNKEKQANKQKAKDAAARAKERAAAEREAIRQAEDTALALVKEGVEKQRQAVNLSYTRQIEDLKRKIEEDQKLKKKDQKLTIQAREEINQTIQNLEKQQQQDLEKLSIEETKKRIEHEQKLIELKLQSIKEGSENEYQLRLQHLTRQEQAELANTELTEEMKAAIRAKYEKQYDDLDKQKLAKTLSDQQAAIDLEWRQRLDSVIQGSLEESNLKLQQAQAEYDALANMDAAAKAALYGEGIEADTTYTNALLDNKQKLQDAEKANQEAIKDATQKQLDAARTIGGGFEELLNTFAEDNETFAAFAKTVALFNIALDTAKAIASATASAKGITPIDYAIQVAAGIATVMANIAKAKKLLTSEKQPKAPKFATGGTVTGSGSTTSDSIVANLSSGESILNAPATAMFAPLLSALNQIGGGIPINIAQSSQQVIGEEMLARAFAKGLESLPTPVVSVEEINTVNTRVKTLENLSLQ